MLHADDRPPDGFAGSDETYQRWLECLLGVSDLLDEGIELADADARISWELRQTGLNHEEDQLPVLAVHYEVLRELWPELRSEKAHEIEDAFKRHTGMSIADYFAVGAAVQARLTTCGQSPSGTALLKPSEMFEKTKVGDELWKPFFALLGRDLDELRTELRAEETRYGPTTYGALSFERFPLLRFESDLYLPVFAPSLARRVTEGVFHLLAEAAEADGRDRRHYISPFGNLFQALVETSLRRGVAASSADTARITGDILYGPKRSRIRSCDVILLYERQVVFVEVVSGPAQVGTLTRGDLSCFEWDLERLVLNKVKQLNVSIDDFLARRLDLPGADPATVSAIWPVLVSSHPFPQAEYVNREVQRRLEGCGYLRQPRVAPLALVSAEELCFCEGYMERDRTFLSLIRGWKTGSEADQPLKNYLVTLGGGRAPASDHAERTFARATADYARRLLGSEWDPDDVLVELRSDRS